MTPRHPTTTPHGFHVDTDTDDGVPVVVLTLQSGEDVWLKPEWARELGEALEFAARLCEVQP